MVAYFKRKTKQFIESKNMYMALVIASFSESIIVPIPLEAVLIPLMQAKREKIWLLAFLATLGCIFGAIIGYGVGYYLFDQFAEQIAGWFSDPQQLENVKNQMQQQGFWYVLSVGIIPIPFQIAMLAAGAAKYSLFMFLLATLIARTIRYFGLALLVKVAGNKAEAIFRKYKIPTAIVLTLAVALFWWIKH
ncbi:VTT domain-containing protein [Paraglaciecola sp. 20A4]|uniref:YqaA family protein n=1 Tax=Paraglaciecola sp. 20A4 TaxID=2687288 RepID=UPI001408188C|nr:VTT domain-containing protein [Paraglaciecola sp. 20A4]